MKSPIRLLATISIILAFIDATPVRSQAMSGPQIDSLVERNRAVFHVPGIAISIIKDGKVAYSKGYGVRSLLTRQPVDQQTLFGIASNSKAFTAAALGILVDEGKLKWDDRVTRYLPNFRLYDAYATREMTIRDLLSHRSGLATGAGDLMHDPDSTDFTTHEIIYKLRYLKPVYSFRGRFAYDNNLYIVAGAIIAKLSNMSWEAFIEQRILRPLRMDQSSASYYGCQHNTNIIDAHRSINDSVRVITRYTSTKTDPAGGIYSSVEEMSRWLLLLLNNGRYGEHLEKQLLSEPVIQTMWSPQTLIPVGKGGAYHTHFAAYGLGWFMADVRGYKQILHTGQDNGMVSEVAMIPELGLGIVVLTNQEGGAIGAITDQITDSYLGIAGTDWTAETRSRSEAFNQAGERVKKTVWQDVSRRQAGPAVDTQKYTGVYHDNWFGDVSITVRQNQLWFAARRSPQLRGPLLPYKNDTFVIRWESPEVDADAFVLFKTSATGQVDAIRLTSVVPSMGYNFDDLDFRRRKK